MRVWKSNKMYKYKIDSPLEVDLIIILNTCFDLYDSFLIFNKLNKVKYRLFFIVNIDGILIITIKVIVIS